MTPVFVRKRVQEMVVSPRMTTVKRRAPLLLVLLILSGNRPDAEAVTRQSAPRPPWSPEVRCALNPTNDKGLHPDALAALRNIKAAHRITQGINHEVARGNVHDTDGTINGKPYTGAVDISVRCLTAAQIQQFLGQLTDAGFAAWYRKPGADGWTGPPHIHAIWAACSLKEVLRRQVTSWLAGNNGLGGNTPYAFWQPSVRTREKVAAAFRKFNTEAR
jgi:hypothetical protein